MVTKKRLIDANTLMEQVKAIHRAVDTSQINTDYDKGFHSATSQIQGLIAYMPTVDAIPIAVIKMAIAGINAADQCDQAGRYDFELRNALRTVLKWYGSPIYKDCERRFNVQRNEN